MKSFVEFSGDLNEAVFATKSDKYTLRDPKKVPQQSKIKATIKRLPRAAGKQLDLFWDGKKIAFQVVGGALPSEMSVVYPEDLAMKPPRTEKDLEKIGMEIVKDL